MDDLKPGLESVTATKEVPKGSEEVLIEIDGKFELVSAADMQANHPADPSSHTEANMQGQAASKNSQNDLVESPSKQNQSDVDNYDEDFEHDSCASSSPSVVRNSTPQSSSKEQSSRDQAVLCNPESLDANAGLLEDNVPSDKTVDKEKHGDSNDEAKDSAVVDSQTDLRQQHSSVEIIVSEHDTRRVHSESTCTNKSISTVKSRTKSAPESRSSLSQQQDEADRRVMCERAFKAWLAKKDAQISEERKLQRANTRVLTREEKLEKIEMCENAYKAWLEDKNRQVRERRYLQRTIKSASGGNKEQESASAFRNWLQQKQIQRQKEKAVEIRRVKEEAEVAQKVDPSVANQAYRRWLRKKNIEAREEAARRLELQRYYFRQGRLLKESLRNRFQGF